MKTNTWIKVLALVSLGASLLTSNLAQNSSSPCIYNSHTGHLCGGYINGFMTYWCCAQGYSCYTARLGPPNGYFEVAACEANPPCMYIEPWCYADPYNPLY